MEEAQHLAQSWSLNITFHCQDALEANLEDAELVWLNSYAWPSEVKQSLVGDKVLAVFFFFCGGSDIITLPHTSSQGVEV